MGETQKFGCGGNGMKREDAIGLSATQQILRRNHAVSEPTAPGIDPTGVCPSGASVSRSEFARQTLLQPVAHNGD